MGERGGSDMSEMDMDRMTGHRQIADSNPYAVALPARQGIEFERPHLTDPDVGRHFRPARRLRYPAAVGTGDFKLVPMEMPIPDNTLPMMSGQDPFGAIEMGACLRPSRSAPDWRATITKTRAGTGSRPGRPLTN